MYQQFLQTGRPSNDAIYQDYRLKPLPIIARTSFSTGVEPIPGWPDKLGLPELSWYASAAKTKTPTDELILDLEDWAVTTEADRIETARKFAIVHQTLKRYIPRTKIGFYGYTPLRDLFRAINSKNSTTFKAWQADNDDMAEMVAAVDMLCPTIYWYYNRATNGTNAGKDAALYFRRNLEEAIRLRDTFSTPSKPIIPYIWWMAHSSPGPLDLDVWESMIQTSLDMCGNAIAWGGWLQTWNPNDKWLKILQERSTTNTDAEL